LGQGPPEARGLTEATGGLLRVDSRPGAGATFAIVLPARR
jgi:signal transduction histidine kinase